MTTRTSVPTVQQITGLEEYVDLATVFASPLFRIRRWRCLHDGEVLREERTNEWDVMSVVNHGAFVQHVGRDSALIDPTCVVLHRAWEPYRTSHPFGCGDNGFHITMRRDVLGEAAERDGTPVPREAIRVARIGGRSRALLRQRILHRRLCDALPVDPLEVEEAILALLAEVRSDLSRRAETPRHRRRATRRRHERVTEAAKTFLLERLSEPLRLDDVAEAVHVSPYHLCRIFKRTSGETIHQYRNRLRLLEALEPVAEPGTDLTALALDLGYSSHSHFTAAFRRLFGLTPTELRRTATTAGLRAVRQPGLLR